MGRINVTSSIFAEPPGSNMKCVMQYVGAIRVGMYATGQLHRSSNLAVTTLRRFTEQY